MRGKRRKDRPGETGDRAGGESCGCCIQGIPEGEQVRQCRRNKLIGGGTRLGVG